MKLIQALIITAFGLTLAACDKKDGADAPATKTESAVKTPAKAEGTAPEAPKAGDPTAANPAAAKAAAANPAAGAVDPTAAPAVAAPAVDAPPADAPPAVPFDDALAESGIKLMEEMGTLVDANKDDCDKIAEAISGFADKNGETFAKLKAMKPTPEQEQGLQAKYGERIKAASGKMMGGMMKCQGNEKLAEAMKKL